MNNNLRTTNYQLNTSDERQATCDEFAPFWSFFAAFCAFCASLRLKRTVLSRLLKKAISMALWTKATLCGKSSLLEQSLPRTPIRQIRSLPTYQVGPRNLCNPRLINDLRACKVLYNCRETFTDVMSALQIRPFLTNKANFRKSQMNINKVLTRDYENRTLGQLGKTKPIQTQYKPNSNPIKAKTNPIQTQTNPISEPHNTALRLFAVGSHNEKIMVFKPRTSDSGGNLIFVCNRYLEFKIGGQKKLILCRFFYFRLISMFCYLWLQLF
jgi:hypothetical protein